MRSVKKRVLAQKVSLLQTNLLKFLVSRSLSLVFKDILFLVSQTNLSVINSAIELKYLNDLIASSLLRYHIVIFKFCILPNIKFYLKKFKYCYSKLAGHGSLDLSFSSLFFKKFLVNRNTKLSISSTHLSSSSKASFFPKNSNKKFGRKRRKYSRFKNFSFIRAIPRGTLAWMSRNRRFLHKTIYGFIRKIIRIPRFHSGERETFFRAFLKKDFLVSLFYFILMNNEKVSKFKRFLTSKHLECKENITESVARDYRIQLRNRCALETIRMTKLNSCFFAFYLRAAYTWLANENRFHNKKMPFPIPQSPVPLSTLTLLLKKKGYGAISKKKRVKLKVSNRSYVRTTIASKFRNFIFSNFSFQRNAYINPLFSDTTSDRFAWRLMFRRRLNKRGFVNRKDVLIRCFYVRLLLRRSNHFLNNSYKFRLKLSESYPYKLNIYYKKKPSISKDSLDFRSSYRNAHHRINRIFSSIQSSSNTFSKILSTFIGLLVKDGKRDRALRLFKLLIRKIARSKAFRSSNISDPLSFLVCSVARVSPRFYLKSKRIGGVIYRLPVFIRRELSSFSIGIRWILAAANQRSDRHISDRIFHEIIDSYNRRSWAYKRKMSVYKASVDNISFIYTLFTKKTKKRISRRYK